MSQAEQVAEIAIALVTAAVERRTAGYGAAVDLVLDAFGRGEDFDADPELAGLVMAKLASIVAAFVENLSILTGRPMPELWQQLALSVAAQPGPAEH